MKAAEVRQLLLRHKKTRGPAPERMDDPTLVSSVTAFNAFYILSPELLFHSAFLPLSLSLFFFFFGCGPFLKSLLNLLQYCFCFISGFLAMKHVGS